MMVKPSVRATAAAVLLGLAPAHSEPLATTAGPSSASFAIVSPAVAEKLQTLVDTKEAKSVVAKADAALTQAPGPIPRMHTEGTLPHQGIWDISIKAGGDWPIMLNLALAWQITHDPKYLQAEDKYLNAWVDVYKVSFNPIDETNFDRVILAYDLTKSGLSEATRQKVDAFLKDMSQGYLTRIENKEDPGNWQSHRIKLATLSAFSLGDEALIAQAKTAFTKHVTVNILPDGSTYDFHHRDALHYTVYDLEPLIMCALAARAHRQDWYHAASPSQPSVALAIDWLVPYATGEQTHEEFVHSTVKFDAERAQAGMKGYSGPWEPRTSMFLFQLATIFDPKYQPVCAAVIKEKGYAQDWSTLLIQAGI
jgi:hypothetical protein